MVRKRRTLMVLALAAMAQVTASAVAEEVFIDKGACPGEGCAYGESWTAKSTVALRAVPARSATIIARIAPRTSVVTVTGEVHTWPGRFVVRQPRTGFRPGDVLLVYTYLGEGVFRVGNSGRLMEVDLGFSPWGGTAGTRCELSAACWGTLEHELRFDWWVQVRTAAGALGWTADVDEFERGP